MIKDKEAFIMQKNNVTAKSWPADCIWPEPLYDGDGNGMFWEAEEAELMDLDEEGESLMEIREYFDYLVSVGRLNEDYTWCYDYEGDEDDWLAEDDPEDFIPEMGEEYWTDCFEYDMWEFDLSDHINRLKLDMDAMDVLSDIENIIDYHFINENLLRQAFTRRSFAVEHGLNGCNEELELVGDSVLNTVITQEIVRQLTDVNTYNVEAPFVSLYDEGDISKIRSRFVSGENLSAKMEELGLSKYILCGTSEVPGAAASEDVMEALIGAVMIDSEWDWNLAEKLIDRLLCVQLDDPDRLVQKTYFEMLNSWHQKHFGSIPKYTIDGVGMYYCTIRFEVPDNNKGIRTSQLLWVQGITRSKAREHAAEMAYRFIVNNGLLININEAGITPDADKSINQLQELFQKKYIEVQPEYDFFEGPADYWHCTCICGGTIGSGEGSSKTRAKKAAAYDVLTKLIK